MKIRRKWLRDLASIVFSVYYLIAAEQADEKVRKVRGTLTVDHLRISWNKATTPYLSFFTSLLRPRLASYPPRAIRIPRPPESSYNEPISAWLYFDGPLAALKNQTNVILDIPGGGFVAMNPRTNDDKLLAWAGRTGLPILSLDYKKAPENPYPYALNECYDVYHTLMASRGRCIGMAGNIRPRVIVTGDSAGGNLATGVVLMVLQSAGTDSRRRQGEEMLPVPDGLILIYPGLDMNIGNWMTDEQMSLIRDRRTRKTNRNILRRKSEDYYKLRPETPQPSDEEEDNVQSVLPPPERRDEAASLAPTSSAKPNLPNPSAAHLIIPANVATQAAASEYSKPRQMKTRLAMSSMISYTNDRILTPEMMRAMIILYVGPHNRPDFSTDFLLSPLLAPEALLARFPKTYFLTGERDPLVDDTVIFAGRLRQAKLNSFREKQELGLLGRNAEFDEKDHVEVMLIPGISHGFLQFVSVFPEGWKHIFRCARWMEDVFASSSSETLGLGRVPTAQDPGSSQRTLTGADQTTRHHHRALTESSGDEDRPLEMSSLKPVKANSNTRGGGRRVNGKVVRSDGTGGRDRQLRKNRSMVSLASDDDLLGRRMKGLAGGLMGMTENDG